MPKINLMYNGGVKQDSPSRERSAAVVIITIMACAAVAQAFGRFTWGVVLPDARDDVLGGSNTVAGLMGTLNVTAYLLGTLGAAFFASKISLTNLLRRGLILSTTGLLTMWLVPVPGVMGVALFLMGFGGAMIWIPSPALAARQLPAHRKAFAAGLVGSGIGIGIVFTGQLAAWMRDDAKPDTWKQVYGVEAVIGLLALVGALVILQSRGETVSARGGLGGFQALRRVEGWAPLSACYTAYGFAYLLAIAFLVARLEDDSGLSSGTASAAFSLMGFATIVGGLSVGFFVSRFGVRRTLMTGSGVFGASTLLVLVGSSPWIWFAAAGLGLMFSTVPASIATHIVQHASDEDYGPAYSAATLAFGFAQMLAPQLGGVIADAAGSFAPVFVLSAGFSAAGVIAAWKLPRHT
ncbi:MAG: YbfB/YjiJ family MFS transporter [Actinomycetia bacterium]|nr:YbfB/YjiJ family MFS transporter [Actinomycetes bacterium]